jgi:hypothetical protein
MLKPRRGVPVRLAQVFSFRFVTFYALRLNYNDEYTNPHRRDKAKYDV